MKNIYSKMKFVIGRILDMRLVAQENSNYLEGNTFYLKFLKKDYIHDNSEESIKFLENEGRLKNVKRTNMKSKFFDIINVFFKIHLKKTSPAEFKGNLLMKTRQNNIKIFDFQDKLVLNKIDNKAEYTNIKNIYTYFKEYYKLPLLNLNEEKRIFIEKLITFKDYKSWTSNDKNSVIKELLNSLKLQTMDSNIVIKNVSPKEIYKIFIENKTEHQMSEIVEQLIPHDISNNKLPVIKCHGDLNFNNILLEVNKNSNEYYIIDWEDTGDYIFFYDFLNCIFVEAMYLNDYSLLKSYLNGKYDEDLGEIFRNLSLQFVAKYKKYYLAIYVMERINEFEIIQNKDRLNILIPKYKSVLNNISNY